MQLRVSYIVISICLAVGSCQAMQWAPLDADGHPLPPSPRTGRVAPVQHSPAVALSQPVPTAPTAPLRPDQTPATPPQVTFGGGQLAIVAQNSTLGDVLRAVRNLTGASVEVPANATERVAGNFGPGPARDVLSSLLNGSHFNYVLLGSATNPDALERVILTVRSGASDQVATGDPASTAPPGPANNPEMAAEDQTEPASEEPNLFAEEPGTTEDQTPNPFGQPAANTRTPEQMLQDLQHQQEIQQQIQQRQQQLGVNPSLQVPRGVQPGGLPPVQPQ